MRNSESRINTTFFVIKIKHLLTVYGIIELQQTMTSPSEGDILMITQKQLTLADIFSDCQKIYESDKPQFLFLLQQHIDLDEIVPASFRKHFYASTGRTRKYPLYAFLWALIAGVYQPAKEMERSKVPAALTRFLKEYPEVGEVELHLDNDRAGRRQWPS